MSRNGPNKNQLVTLELCACLHIIMYWLRPNAELCAISCKHMKNTWYLAVKGESFDYSKFGSVCSL